MSRRAMRTQYATLCLIAASVLGHNAQAAVGHTSGEPDVSKSGEVTYTIPIFAPPGIDGLTPQLALVYGSRQREYLAGVGWAVAGLSEIRVKGHPIFPSCGH